MACFQQLMTQLRADCRSRPRSCGWSKRRRLRDSRVDYGNKPISLRDRECGVLRSRESLRTFYGQYRYGDAGPPQKGQVLRMLQMEKGYDGLGAPPWVDADLYRAGSAVLSAGKVETPLMLIHGISTLFRFNRTKSSSPRC